jgi:hypothetical protein
MATISDVFKGRTQDRNESAVSIKKIYISEAEIFVNPKYQMKQSAWSLVSVNSDEEDMIILANCFLIVYRNHAV